MPQQQEFSELLESNLCALNRFVLGLVGDHFDAADIVQDTVIKAFVHFRDFRAESKFKTWLISIALNEVRGRRRRESRSRTSYVDGDQLEQLAGARSSESPYHQYQENEASRLVEDAIASLHPTYKEIIRLRALDGIDISDTARRLSISVPAAKARYYRAFHRLSHAVARRTRKPLRRTLAREAGNGPSLSAQAV
jgi:RNA polymerase sigma-70 factor, ECF subfamily